MNYTQPWVIHLYMSLFIIYLHHGQGYLLSVY